VPTARLGRSEADVGGIERGRAVDEPRCLKHRSNARSAERTAGVDSAWAFETITVPHAHIDRRECSWNHNTNWKPMNWTDDSATLIFEGPPETFGFARFYKERKSESRVIIDELQ
jgi:hypothetical protein